MGLARTAGDLDVMLATLIALAGRLEDALGGWLDPDYAAD